VVNGTKYCLPSVEVDAAFSGSVMPEILAQTSLRSPARPWSAKKRMRKPENHVNTSSG